MSEQKLILLIDDEQDLVDMIGFQLRARGFRVDTAPDGRAGLERLKTVKPDLIVLDMNMPNMGGIEFFQNICDEHSNPRYPVFVLTACTNMMIWNTLFADSKIEGFMPKPFEIEQLISAIDEATRRRGHARPASKPSAGIDIKISNEVQSLLNDGIFDVSSSPEQRNVTPNRNRAGDDAVAAGKKMSGHRIIPSDEQRNRVIVLENDPVLYRELKTVLEGYHCAIHLATTAQECLKAAEGAHVDLVILKHFLGDDNMEALAIRLKEMPQLLKTPIIIYDNIGRSLVKEILGQQHELFVMNEEGQRLLAKVKALLGRL